MKIALVVQNLVKGGGIPAVARFIKNCAAQFGCDDLVLVSLATSINDEVSVRLTAPSSWLVGVRTKHGVWDGARFIHIGAAGVELEFQRYRRRNAVDSVLADCDLIQVVCGSAAWANAVIGLGKPVSVHVATRAKIERRTRDAHPQGLSGWWRKAMTPITNRLDDRALRRADAVQVMNPWMFEYVRELNAGRDVDLRYAPPGIDAQFFSPMESRDPTRDPYVLCVGRMDDPRKNVGLLLEAYALLPTSSRERVRMVLTGSSEPPLVFWQRVEALGLRGRIEFVKQPDRESLAQLYQRASIFVLPSDEEGFGMVLLEAMACGVPVVSTRSGGPEGIVSDGEDGFLVPRDHAMTLADRMNRLLADAALNVTMGRKAREKIELRYAEEVAGLEFHDVWKRLLSKREGC